MNKKRLPVTVFIINKAKQNPNINFIGIEKYASVLVKCIKKLDDLQEELKRLKEKEYTIYVTDVTGGESSYQIKPAEKYILVMGNEGKGVREEIKSYATLSLYIPMNQRCESLNVGVATSILLYALKDSEKNG